MDQITLQWLGHACFRVSSGKFYIVLDPYEDGSVPGLGNLRVTADAVLCSHGHGDHCAEGNVVLSAVQPENPFHITTIPTFHDEQNGRLRGRNSMTLLQVGQVRVAHLGDLGCMPTDEQLEHLKNLDALMLPIGGFFTLEQEQCRTLLELLQPTVILPMHYRGSDAGYPDTASLEEFLRPGDVVRRYESDSIVIQKGMKPQIAILKRAL